MHLQACSLPHFSICKYSVISSSSLNFPCQHMRVSMSLSLCVCLSACLLPVSAWKCKLWGILSIQQYAYLVAYRRPEQARRRKGTSHEDPVLYKGGRLTGTPSHTKSCRRLMNAESFSPGKSLPVAYPIPSGHPQILHTYV